MKGILVPLIIISMTGIVVAQPQGSARRSSNNDFNANASPQPNSFSPLGPQQSGDTNVSADMLAPFGVLFSDDEINTIVKDNQMVISDIEPRDNVGRELPIQVVNGIALVHKKNQGNRNLPTVPIFPFRQNKEPGVLAFELNDLDLQNLESKQLTFQINDNDRGKYSKVAFFYRRSPQNIPTAQPASTSNLAETNFSSPGEANFVGPVLPDSIRDRRGETTQPQQLTPRAPWRNRQNDSVAQSSPNSNTPTSLVRAPLNSTPQNNSQWSLPSRTNRGLRQDSGTGFYNSPDRQGQQNGQSKPTSLAPIRQSNFSESNVARANPSYFPTNIQNAAQNKIAELERKIAQTEEKNKWLEDQRKEAVEREASANRQLLNLKTSSFLPAQPITDRIPTGISSYASTQRPRFADRRNQFNNTGFDNSVQANLQSSDQPERINDAMTRQDSGKSRASLQNDNSVTSEGKKQSDSRKLLFVTCVLLASLGFNIYLAVGWRGSYVRFHELADELRETFSNPV